MHIPKQTNLPSSTAYQSSGMANTFRCHTFTAMGPEVRLSSLFTGEGELLRCPPESGFGACTLAAFDEPGTGLAAFDPNARLDVSALADMAQGVADQLLPGPYFLPGASMGGVVSTTCVGLDQSYFNAWNRTRRLARTSKHDSRGCPRSTP